MNELKGEVNVAASATEVKAVITDRRPDVIETFHPLSPEQRQGLAGDAWMIGMRALKNAYAQAQEARLSDIGRTLKEDLSNALGEMVLTHQERVSAELKRYLDPTDGEFARRVDAFVKGDGELSRALAHFVGPSGSVLAESLARQVGEQSPLFRKLSPTDSQGVVQSLKETLGQVLEASQEEMGAALDPLNAESPVARFLTSLRTELKKADNDRSAQMTTALKALDANDPNSLISNLARQTRDASKSLLVAMNPADPKSPLALLKNCLTELLEAHIKSSSQLLKDQDRRAQAFEKDIREAVARIETQRQAQTSSTQGGLAFEDAVASTVTDLLRGAPVVCARTGNVVGIRERCKVGDLVVSFTDESAWAGTAIVFESKHDASYGILDALKELDIARTNREAQVGVFVMAQSHAAGDFPTFSRHGHNILVTWDPDDGATFPRLQAAVMLAGALASRRSPQAETANLEALKDLEAVLTEQLTRVEKMRKASDAIRRNNETIQKELDKAEEALADLAENAKETLAALAKAAINEDQEREEPIGFHRENTDAA